MAESTLLSRLDGIDARFEEVSLLITDPSVISDMKRFVKLTKEYKDLEKLTKVTSKYKQMLRDIEEAREVLDTETDPDMRELAKEDLDANTAALPEIEEEIKLLLIPEDPEDDKNVILEIRGGTGGDEAAIFAGDLFRMYAILRDKRLEDGDYELQRRLSRRIQGNNLLCKWREGLRHSEIRVGRTPRTARASDGDSRPRTHIGGFGCRAARG